MEKERELAAMLIDMVEDAIRQEHPKIERIADETVYEGSLGTPGTLLFGDAYYALEDELARVIASERLSPDHARAVAEAIAYGLQDSFRDTPSPAPVSLSWVKVEAYGRDLERNGGDVKVIPFRVDLAERNTITEAMHRLNRKGIVQNGDVDASVAAGYEELKGFHYPATKEGEKDGSHS